MSHQDDVFMRTFALVLAILVIMAFIFYFIAAGVSPDSNDGGSKMAEEAVAERIAPVATVVSGEVTEVADAGPQVPAACAACHSSGFPGAPQVGDKEAWSARVSQGMATLVSSAKNGKGAMPPQGGAMSDEQLKEAIVIMLEKSGIETK